MLRNTVRLLARNLRRDPSLVALPPGVHHCQVFCNAVSVDEEERIYEELSRVLQREGEVLHVEGSTPEHKVVKHTYLEMFGEKPFTDVKNWRRREVRRLPGIVWSPTLMSFLREVAPPLLGAMPDTARVVEHNIPGYEMHIEHPTVGACFLYLNLLSDTVLHFDDEGTSRRGQVFLPSRSLLCVSGEARWGFRFGEPPDTVHFFSSSTGRGVREVETDMRLSVQVWKLCTNLLDGRILQERLEAGVEQMHKHFVEDAAKICDIRAAKTTEVAHLPAYVAPTRLPNASASQPNGDVMQSFMTSAMETTAGEGVLGGDLVRQGDGGVTASAAPRSSAKKNLGDVQSDYGRYKEQFGHIHGIMQEMKVMQDAGQPVNDMWLRKKLVASTPADPEKDKEEGFDAENMEGTWDRVDAKARFYKAKLRTMDYDGTAFLSSRMPDVSQDAPLDMKTTIRKIAPFVKDGEKMLSSLPGGDQ